jgi:hypothetical protein
MPWPQGGRFGLVGCWGGYWRVASVRCHELERRHASLRASLHRKGTAKPSGLSPVSRLVEAYQLAPGVMN